jgi:hypothetical protein
LHSLRVPDAKYIPKGQVSKNWIVADEVDAFIKAMVKAYGLTAGEAASHVILEFKRVMGAPPEPPNPPKVPAGKTFKWPATKKKA